MEWFAQFRLSVWTVPLGKKVEADFYEGDAMKQKPVSKAFFTEQGGGIQRMEVLVRKFTGKAPQ